MGLGLYKENPESPVAFPGAASGKEPGCKCRRCKGLGFDPWGGKIPWRRAWQPTPVFWPVESPWTRERDRLQSMGVAKSQTPLSNSAHRANT